MKFVAEISANHAGSLETAIELVVAASKSGATHVKFQTFEPEQMAPPGKVIQSGCWAGREMVDLYQEAHTPKEWHKLLFDLSTSIGVVPFSTPFHPDDVEFLESIDCQMYKIASCELLYKDLLEAVAETRKPVIVSTGMATLDEIEFAVNIVGNPTLLKCTSAYPAEAGDANLRGMLTLKERFGCPVGLSDHSGDFAVIAAAAALGAEVIESHLKLHDDTLDAEFSLCPEEFEGMVRFARRARDAVGNGVIRPAESEKPTSGLRRSWWFSKNAEAGETVTRDHVACARPAGGLSANEPVLGSVLAKSVRRGDPVTQEDLCVK